MSREPLRSILLGYAGAGAGSVGLGALGLGLVPSVLVAWFGGAAATLVFAAVAVKQKTAIAAERPGAASVALDTGEISADLRRWEEDAAADAAVWDRRRSSGDAASWGRS